MIEEELPKLRPIFTKGLSPTSPAFLWRITPTPAEIGPRRAGGPAGGVNVSRPQRPRRRHELRHQSRGAAEVTRAVKQVTKKAGLYQAVSQRRRHCRHCGGLRGRRGGRHQPHQHPAWHAHRFARQKPIIANTMGACPAPPSSRWPLRMVYQVYEAVQIPIIGMGACRRRKMSSR